MNKTLMLAILAVLLSSCSNKKDEQENAVGKYLYMGTDNILHVSKECRRLADVAEFLDTATIYANDEYKYCTYCFTDSTYEHVQWILHRDTYRKWLYERLKETFRDTPSYQVYIEKIHDPQKAKKLYNAICNEGWDVGTYEEFSESMGI